MCGICGSLNFGGQSDQDKAAIIELMKLMGRRGPDDSGLWADEPILRLWFSTALHHRFVLNRSSANDNT